jgi:hypothetical protein
MLRDAYIACLVRGEGRAETEETFEQPVSGFCGYRVSMVSIVNITAVGPMTSTWLA